MTKTLIILLLASTPMLYAQKPAQPTPQTSNVSFSIGAQAFGIALTENSSPASDVQAKVTFTRYVTLRSDNLLAPGANFQYYGAGAEGPLPDLFRKTTLKGLELYWDATIGADRIVPATGASQSHIAAMAGVGLRWKKQTSAGDVQPLIEVNWFHTPGAPWGANVPAVSGGLAFVFGRR